MFVFELMVYFNSTGIELFRSIMGRITQNRVE